jgi:pimeloyl-ACP methyl ester carboxylesterase
VDLIDDARRICWEVIRSTGRRPIVIGHSMGGLVAQVLAAGGLCARAALVTPAPCMAVPNRSPWVPWLYANVLLSGRRRGHHRAWRWGIDTALLHRLRPMHRAVVRAAMRWEPAQVLVDMSRGTDIEPSDVAIPLLVVSGGRDRVFPEPVVRRLADLYRAGRPEPLEYLCFLRNGHWIIDEPDNESFVEALLCWLAEDTAIHRVAARSRMGREGPSHTPRAS